MGTKHGEFSMTSATASIGFPKKKTKPIVLCCRSGK